MSDKVQNIMDEIKELTLLEASELVKALEEASGFPRCRSPVMVAGGAGGGGAAAAPAEEKTEFTVVLTNVGRQQDRRHQSCPRSHEPWPQGSQGLGRWSSEDHQGRRQQG